MADVDPLVIEEISWLNFGIDAEIPLPASPVAESWDRPTNPKPPPIDIPSSLVPTPFPTQNSVEDMSFSQANSMHLNSLTAPSTPIFTPSSPSRTRKSCRPNSPTHTLPISQSAPSDIYIPSSSPSSPIPRPKPAYRSEWLYRRPNYPRARPATSPPTTSMPPTPQYNRPHISSHTKSNSEDQQELWPAAIRPRSRVDRSVPMLETRLMTKPRSSSLSSVSSSMTTNASSSSRPETPVSAGSRSRHRHPGPSKSILTRTSSNATKSSSMSVSCNKSVKFVEMPTIHHTSAGYWDMDGIDVENVDPIIQEDDELEVDVDTRTIVRNPSTKRSKGIGLGRFLQRRPSPVTSRPAISGPFALGSIKSQPKPEPQPHHLPPLPFVGDGSSIRSVSSAASVSRSPSISSSVPLRPAPSLESFRSVKSTGGRSTRSLGSVRSTGSTGKFRSWLSRMGLSFRAEMGCAVS